MQTGKPHPPDRRRRHRGLQGVRTDPAAIRKAGGTRVTLRADRGRRPVRHPDERSPRCPSNRSTPTCSISRTRPRWAISSCQPRGRPGRRLRRRPPTCWPRWRRASPTISPPLCCSPPTSRCSPRPAMNVRMWQHEATRRNVAQLRADGVTVLEPDEGEMACGEYRPGAICPSPRRSSIAIHTQTSVRPEAKDSHSRRPEQPLRARPEANLAGKHMSIVTAGPTHEPIDPVRVIANRSSGKQGFAIAAALAAARRAGHPRRRPGRTLPTPAGVRRNRRRDGAAADGRRR